jgi:pimeloyl-ACP methyl ester carboxylesterase
VEHLQVDGAVIEYEVQGNGEPVLLVPLSIIGDGLGRPLLAERELASRYCLIHYHRRGYMGSTPGSEPLTTSCQAGDAAALLKHLGVGSAHIAGHSFGGLIALQLALDAPALVHSLALLEPSLPMLLSGKAPLDRLFPRMLELYRSGNKCNALEFVSGAIFGPSWQSVLEQAVPGSIEQAIRDFDTFVQELTPIQEWQFSRSDAATIRQPVLSVMGVHSSPYQQEVRQLLHAWLPQTEDCDVQSTHLLQMQDPQDVAHGLTEFFRYHPM